MSNPEERAFQAAKAELKRRVRLHGSKNAFFKEKLQKSGQIKRSIFYNLLDDRKFIFSEDIKKKLIAFISPGLSLDVYSYVESIVEIGGDESQSLAGFCGTYKYVRRNYEADLTHGFIKIEEKDGFFAFDHMPIVKKEKEEGGGKGKEKSVVIEHEGFVFKIHNKIFLLGLGLRYIRLAIIFAPDVKNIRNEEIQGIVLTPDGRFSAPYAYRFMMVHESHHRFDEFDAMGIKMFERRIAKAGMYPGLITIV